PEWPSAFSARHHARSSRSISSGECILDGMRGVWLLLLAACGGKANDTIPDGSMPMADAGTPRVDAGRPNADASATEGGPSTCSGPSECHPHDVSSFMPIWKPP